MILHELFSALVGPDFADRVVKLMDNRDDRMSQAEENLRLRRGIKIAVSPNDPHQKHLDNMMVDLARLRREYDQGRHSENELVAFLEHRNQHRAALERQKETEAVLQNAATLGQPQARPPEAGGTPSADGSKRSPMAGGMSAALMPKNQNPGPPDGRKYGQAGRENGIVAQTENQPR